MNHRFFGKQVERNNDQAVRGMFKELSKAGQNEQSLCMREVIEGENVGRSKYPLHGPTNGLSKS